MSGDPLDEWQLQLGGLGLSKASDASSGAAWRRELDDIGVSQQSVASDVAAAWRAALSQESAAESEHMPDALSQPPAATGEDQPADDGLLVAIGDPGRVGDGVAGDVGGELVPSEASPPLVLFAAKSRTIPDEELHQKTFEAAEHLVIHKEGVGTTTKESKELGLDRKTVRDVRALTAAVCFHFERQSWENMVATLAKEASRGGARLLLYLEFVSYDGVDMWLESKTPTENLAAELPARAHTHEGEPTQQYVERLHTSKVHRSTGVTKLLHSEGNVWMLVQLRGRDVLIKGTRLNWLQVLDRHTAENMVPALESQGLAIGNSKLFSRCVRLACTDGGGNNARSERHLLKRREGWTGLQITCNLHVLSGAHTKVFDLVSEHVSGLVAVGMALSNAGYMSGFRKAMLSAIAKRLEIQPVHDLPADAERYKNMVLDVLVGCSHNDKELRTALLHGAAWD